MSPLRAENFSVVFVPDNDVRANPRAVLPCSGICRANTAAAAVRSLEWCCYPWEALLLPNPAFFHDALPALDFRSNVFAELLGRDRRRLESARREPFAHVG